MVYGTDRGAASGLARKVELKPVKVFGQLDCASSNCNSQEVKAKVHLYNYSVYILVTTLLMRSQATVPAVRSPQSVV